MENIKKTIETTPIKEWQLNTRIEWTRLTWRMETVMDAIEKLTHGIGRLIFKKYWQTGWIHWGLGVSRGRKSAKLSMSNSKDSEGSNTDVKEATSDDCLTRVMAALEAQWNAKRRRRGDNIQQLPQISPIQQVQEQGQQWSKSFFNSSLEMMGSLTPAASALPAPTSTPTSDFTAHHPSSSALHSSPLHLFLIFLSTHHYHHVLPLLMPCLLLCPPLHSSSHPPLPPLQVLIHL